VVEGTRLEIGCTARYRGFESLPLRHFVKLCQNFISDVKEEDTESELPKCIADCCAYPATCLWNRRCMEEGMRESKKAKMVREETIGREDGDEMEK
jgi:hypothetical protein